MSMATLPPLTHLNYYIYIWLNFVTVNYLKKQLRLFIQKKKSSMFFELLGGRGVRGGTGESEWVLQLPLTISYKLSGRLCWEIRIMSTLNPPEVWMWVWICIWVWMDASVGGAVVDWRTVQSVEASVPGRRRRQSVVPSSFFFFLFFFLYHSPRRSFLTDNKLVLVVERGREVFLFLVFFGTS